MKFATKTVRISQETAIESITIFFIFLAYFLQCLCTLSAVVKSMNTSSLSKRVLVVDDDHGILEALQILLEEAGYTVQTTPDGSKVPLEINAFSPDVILLDIWMSGQNGHDICKRLKSMEQTKEIPVILISANRDMATISKACGADDYVAKPFELDELLNKVEKYSGIHWA